MRPMSSECKVKVPNVDYMNDSWWEELVGDLEKLGSATAKAIGAYFYLLEYNGRDLGELIRTDREFWLTALLGGFKEADWAENSIANFLRDVYGLQFNRDYVVSRIKVLALSGADIEKSLEKVFEGARLSIDKPGFIAMLEEIYRQTSKALTMLGREAKQAQKLKITHPREARGHNYRSAQRGQEDPAPI